MFIPHVVGATALGRPRPTVHSPVVGATALGRPRPIVHRYKGEK
jgi:hypothetical protein